jgi:hypothetical protein
MAIKEPYAIKTVLGDTDLELKADPGESFLIRDVLIHNPASNYVTFKTEKTTTGYFRVGGDLGSHLPFPFSPTKHSVGFSLTPDSHATTVSNAVVDAGANQLDQNFAAAVVMGAAAVVPRMSYPQQILKNPPSILAFLAERGLFSGYPVATGETFKITGAKQANAAQVVIYEIHEEADMASSLVNGSKSKDYLFINYGRPGSAINASSDTLYDTIQSPAEFPNFPFDAVVPAKTEIDLIGVLLSNICVAGNTTGKYTYSSYFKLILDRETLFDEDRSGVPLVGLFPPDVAALVSIAEGYGLAGNLSSIDSAAPLIFPSPISFMEGDELNAYLSTVKVSDGGSISAARAELALIEKVRRVG